jgi:hypothetical protein
MKVLADEEQLLDHGPQHSERDALYITEPEQEKLRLARKENYTSADIKVFFEYTGTLGDTYHRYEGQPVYDPLPERTLWDKAKVAHDALQQVMDHSISLVEASNLPNELLEEFKATLGALKTWGQGSTFDKDSHGRPLKDHVNRGWRG